MSAWLCERHKARYESYPRRWRKSSPQLSAMERLRRKNSAPSCQRPLPWMRLSSRMDSHPRQNIFLAGRGIIVGHGVGCGLPSKIRIYKNGRFAAIRNFHQNHTASLKGEECPNPANGFLHTCRQCPKSQQTSTGTIYA
jgi:hypothetical protein